MIQETFMIQETSQKHCGTQKMIIKVIKVNVVFGPRALSFIV